MGPHIFKTTILSITFILITLSCLSPIYPEQMFLQHAASIVVIALLIYDIKIKFLSKTAFTGIIVFLLLHALGARYIYSMVPYNEWTKALFGVELNEMMGWERNHYDRLVHLLFGLIIFPFAYEWSKKKFKINTTAALVIGWLMIQTYSLVYEVFEWLLTLFLSGEQAKNYNGQQGDQWDAHKDMALAMIGSTISFITLFFRSKSNR